MADGDGTTSPEPETPFLSTLEGEITFFRSLMRARPVGIHRHFHVLTIRNWILRDTQVDVPPEDIWAKLRTCYNLDELEALEPDGYASSIAELYNVPHPCPSPSPTENLSRHPFFRSEFTLPADAHIDTLLAARRMRDTASLPSDSPAPSPVELPAPGRGGRRRRGRSSLDIAGLVGGDSDSSALTQESADESVAPTPRGSVMGGTDAGTEDGEEDEEEREESPAATRKKPAKGGNKRAATVAARTRALAAANAARAQKRKKRS